jgi:hypothetical protein
VKRLFNHKQSWTTLSILSYSYSNSVNHDKLTEDISSLKNEMDSILNNALGYYEVAMESTNFYVRTILLVRCASALIKDMYQIRQDLKLEHLKMGLDKIRKNININKNDFHDLICRIYSGRSRSAHSNIVIKSGTALPLSQEFDIHMRKAAKCIKDKDLGGAKAHRLIAESIHVALATFEAVEE